MVRAARFLLPCAVLVLGVSVAGCGNSNTAPTPTLTSAPTATPTAATFTLSGLLTDGTSGGILPGIAVLIINGANQSAEVKTDATGRYAFAGISNGTFNVQYSAVSYVTQTVSVTVAGNTTQNVVLQRAP